ncbi:hypothetical protein B0A53_01850 [Rhodotorula sp. CCFEE 5036]|jgi:hypothetical protein|nr:hypothetical protein B0A53_01850 [Rhodotorula sp. CCFEE 5036]
MTTTTASQTTTTTTAAAAAAAAAAGVQRHPSLRARDAFARLRIGSAGSSSSSSAAAPPQVVPPPPSNVGASTSCSSNPASPASTTSTSSFPASSASNANAANARPIAISGGASLSRAGSLNKKSPSLAAAAAAAPSPGMAHASPAASFLSAFSPPSSVGNRSPSPPPPAQQGSGALGRRTGNMPAFGSVFLPPRGDQSGYKIVVPASPKGNQNENEYEYEYEYVLGKELGRGGMGLVREATRRKIRRRGRRRHRQQPQQQDRGSKRSHSGDDATAVAMEDDHDDDEDAAVTVTTSSSEVEEDEVIRVAVKIIPRHQGHALPFSEAMGIRTNSGVGVGGPVRGGGGGGTDGTTVQRSASLRQNHPGGGPSSSSSSSSSLLAGATHVQRSFSLSQSQSPFGSSGKLLRHHPSQFAPSSSTTTTTTSSSSSSSSSSSASDSRTTVGGDASSSSSPARRNAPSPSAGHSNLGYGGGRHGNNLNNLRPGTLSRGISLAAVEQSPLPTPDGQDEESNSMMLGTSAPERDPGGFFNRARASTVGPVDRPVNASSSSKGSSSSSMTADEGGGGGGGGRNLSRRDGSNEAPTTTIDLDTAEPEDLLDLLLQREIALWRQLTNLAPIPHTGIAMPRPTGFTGKGGHPYVVALLGTHRSDEFDYIFMPLAEGGTLLEYLNDPSNASRGGSGSTSRSCSRSGRDSRSRSVSPSRSASPPASRGPGRSASRGRTGRVTTTKPRPRASIPFAGSLSPPPSATAAHSQKKGLSLRRAGEIFLQIVDGLRWMHEEARVVHRDLKLENVVGCWSVATDEELARAAEEAQEEAENENEGMMTRGRSRSRMRHDHDQQHENRYTSKSRDAATARTGSGGGGGGGGRHRRKRVWKLADFGLAEILPHSAVPQQQQSGVQGVQPLAALARAGSLHRPDGNQPHALASSVGPGGGGPSGLSHSAILPRPPAHASTLPAQQVHRPSPTAATMQAQAVSPLSALLHPVGSLPYSSPEALRSSVPIVHPSGDIWALGCILYALVAGRLPIWDDWELRLRVQLVKGEWEVPEELDSTRARNEDDRVEREMVLEVLKGCLEKDVDRRWTIRQVCESRWIRLARQRDSDARAGRTPTTATTTAAATVAVQVEPVPAVLRRSSRTRTAAQSLGLFLDVQQQSSAGGGSGRGSPGRSTSSNLSLGPSPSPTSPNSDRTLSRGRPSTRSSSHSYSHGPPPAPSAGASGHHTADGGSSPIIGRSNLVVGGEERGRSAQPLPKSASRSRTRLSTRSTSRSSAYAHQYGAGGGSELAEQERKERGRSERRRRWDEAGSSSGRRSVSRTSTGTTTSTSASGMMDDNNSGLAGQSTPAEQDEDLMRDDGEGDDLALASASLSGPSQRAGRSTSRRRHGVSGAARGDREDSGSRSGPAHHLETVGEPY